MRSYLVAGAILVSACAATGPAYEAPPSAPPEHATLVIYRFPNGYGGAYPVEFAVNAVPKAAVLNEEGYTFLWLHANGKDHVIRAGGDKATIRPVAGDTYYVKYEPDAPAGSLSAGGIASLGKKMKNPLTIVPRDAALKELPRYKYQPAAVQTVSTE